MEDRRVSSGETAILGRRKESDRDNWGGVLGKYCFVVCVFCSVENGTQGQHMLAKCSAPELYLKQAQRVLSLEEQCERCEQVSPALTSREGSYSPSPTPVASPSSVGSPVSERGGFQNGLGVVLSVAFECDFSAVAHPSPRPFGDPELATKCF